MRPLEDVRIVAVEQYGAGPFGSMHLAELGADVIKIEDPRTNGDIGRYVPPYQEGEDSLFFETFNRNKRSIGLDLTNPHGRRVFESLVASADALYANVRGDVPERLGLRYQDLKHVNPRLVCCFISGFGLSGGMKSEPGYDYILQGMAGWMSVTGEPDGPPAKTGFSFVDFSTGYAAAVALLAALHAARRDGQGTDCDVSLFDTALNLLSYQATWYLTVGDKPERRARSAHPSLVPFQNFPTATDWIVVACAKEKFWARFAETIGRPEWVEDPRFVDFNARRLHQELLVGLIDDVLCQESAAYWLAKLRTAGVPCGPILDVAAALDQPFATERGLIVETEHPTFGSVRQVVGPIRIGEQRPEFRRAPQRNEDMRDILKELGCSDQEIETLQKEGAFG